MEATEDGRSRAKTSEESNHILDTVAVEQKWMNFSSQETFPIYGDKLSVTVYKNQHRLSKEVMEIAITEGFKYRLNLCPGCFGHNLSCLGLREWTL